MKTILGKLKILLLAGAMALSLTACGGAPSEEKIKEALDAGTITMEDAKAKGWIDDEWVKENYPPIEAGTKIHLFEAFETTYLDGGPASSDLISGKMCLVFFDTAQESTEEKLELFNRISGTMEEKGIPVLGIAMDEDLDAAREKLADIKFPILVYNDAMASSLEDYEELLADQSVSYVFTKEGGFYSAWGTEVTEDAILEWTDNLAGE